MKKVLLTILVVVMGLTAFSQSQSRLINMSPAYPLAIGTYTTDSFQYTHNGLVFHNIIQDTLPAYEIGQIFDQTVRYTRDGHGFYIKADSLHSNNVRYSYEVLDTQSRGPIEFFPETGRFKYYPLVTDFQSFYVKFSATNGTDTVRETVRFNLMPQVVPEVYAFLSGGQMPDGGDYTVITSNILDTALLFNGTTRTVYGIDISGKDIIFDTNVHNKVWGISRREDIKEINIYADRLIIRSAIFLPQTDVTIYAKEIIFEDQGEFFSCINTTPKSYTTRTNEQGMDGADAGNIHLYVRNVRTSQAIRFIMNGAIGQDANRNGIPGNGGNGGIMTSNYDVRNICDFARGSGGNKYDADSSAGSHYGNFILSGNIGSNGHFEMEYSPYSYVHPFYIIAVIRYINDAYINNYNTFALQTSQEYRDLINMFIGSHGIDSCSNENEMEILNNLVELENLINRLELGLDYFGNTTGWVPLLSFEVMFANYQNEIQRAIPTLYLYYWLTKIDHTLEDWVAVNQQAATQSEQAIQVNRQKINNLIAEIPILQDKIEDVEAKITEVNLKIDQIEEYLLRKAKKNVKKRNRIKKAAKLCKYVAQVASYCGPWGEAIGLGVDVASNIVIASTEHPGSFDYNSLYTQTGSNGTMNIQNMLNGIKGIITDSAWSNLSQNSNFIADSYNQILDKVKPLYNAANDIRRILKHGSAPSQEVQAEFIRLRSECEEWKQLNKDLDELKNKKESLDFSLKIILSDVSTTTSQISNQIVELGKFRKEVFENNNKRDHYSMLYLTRMDQRAKNRLAKYHYLVRKAYEYRMLKSYEGECNLVRLFERFDTLASTLNYDSIIDYTNYGALTAVFDDAISEIIESVVSEYSMNAPEQTAPQTFVMSREQIDALNNGEEVILNFYDMGVFSPDEENIRIVNLGVYHLDAHTDGNVGQSGYMDLEMTHSGISKFRKNGQIYWFDHITRDTMGNASSPHKWGARFDANTHNVSPIEPSYASTSLLYSILNRPNNDIGNMMLFSRPSAWSDITMSRKVHTIGGADVVIDSLVLVLQYDFTHRPTTIRNIDITTNEGLLPYIKCSETDINGRSNGNGNLNRSYTRSSTQTVTFTAIEQYGNWYFVNWTNRAGDTVSNVPSLTVNRSTDQFYRANYERRVPILDVHDTIFVSYDGGIYSINVANIGSGDVEMDWYVDDSISSWVHLTGTTEGIDSGMFSFICDVNESGVDRIDSIEIFAPETDVMAKMIYIVQVDNQGFSVSANVVPEGAGYVTGTGFYSSGDTVSLTAIAADSCHFVSWEQNGQVVSTQPNYTFVVNSDVLLTANFSCSEVSIQNTSESTIKIYPNPANHYVTIEGDNILSVRIYSLLGEEVMHHRNNGSSNVSLNLSRLSDGIYLIEVETPETVTHKKLIKHNK